jgi:hypothetical protein
MVRLPATALMPVNRGRSSSSRAKAGGSIAPAGPAVGIRGARGPFRIFRGGCRPADPRGAVTQARAAVGVRRAPRAVRCRRSLATAARAALTGDQAADPRVTFAVSAAGCAIRRARSRAARAQAGGGIADAGAAVGVGGASCPVRRLRQRRAYIHDDGGHNSDNSDTLRDHGGQRLTLPTGGMGRHRPALAPCCARAAGGQAVRRVAEKRHALAPPRHEDARPAPSNSLDASTSAAAFAGGLDGRPVARSAGRKRG